MSDTYVGCCPTCNCADDIYIALDTPLVHVDVISVDSGRDILSINALSHTGDIVHSSIPPKDRFYCADCMSFFGTPTFKQSPPREHAAPWGGVIQRYARGK